VVSPVIASDITTLISGTYLPLSGGTLMGGLNGTSAAFSGATQLATSSGNVLVKTTVDNGLGDALQVAGSVSATLGITATAFQVGNGQYYKATRNSGSLVTDMIGIPSGTDNVRILTTGDFNVVNGSLSTIFGVTNAGAITASSSVTANSFVTTGSVRATNPSDASYFGLFSNDGAMVFDAYGVGAFSSFKVNGTSVLSVDASGAVINGTSRANGYRFAYSTKSSNYTLTDNDDYIVVTNASTITLPTAVGRAGKRYVLRSTVGAGVSSSLTTTSGQTIDGIIGPFSFGFGSYNILIVFSDGSNWFSETFITGG